MIRWLHSVLSLLLVTFAAAHAFAGAPDDAKSNLVKARENLIAMIEAPDASKYDAQIAEISKATKAVDAALASALADKKASPALKDFKKTWEEFKKTRDTQIIPALKGGKKDEAKALAKGIQAERYKKMTELLTAAGAK
jgi:hypothetical protein